MNFTADELYILQNGLRTYITNDLTKTCRFEDLMQKMKITTELMNKIVTALSEKHDFDIF